MHLGAEDRHLALLAVEHMSNGPVAVTNTHTNVSTNGITLAWVVVAIDMLGGPRGCQPHGAVSAVTSSTSMRLMGLRRVAAQKLHDLFRVEHGAT
jgi:hypothetical protein